MRRPCCRLARLGSGRFATEARESVQKCCQAMWTQWIGEHRLDILGVYFCSCDQAPASKSGQRDPCAASICCRCPSIHQPLLTHAVDQACDSAAGQNHCFSELGRRHGGKRRLVKTQQYLEPDVAHPAFALE